MTLIVIEVAQAVAATILTQEEAEVANDDHKTCSGQSTMMRIEGLHAGRTQIDSKRSSRTKTTATPMVMNVQRNMTARIVCGQRRDTNSVRQRRTRWEDACYTNDCIQHTVWNALADGVGREKGLVKEV